MRVHLYVEDERRAGAGDRHGEALCGGAEGRAVAVAVAICVNRKTLVGVFDARLATAELDYFLHGAVDGHLNLQIVVVVELEGIARTKLA